jgi:mycofactocin radical SAM maturase
LSSRDLLKGGLSAPLTVTWEITAGCNLTCIHCLSSSGKRRPGELTLDEARSVVHQLADCEVFQIHFGGGEPFMYPGFMALVELAHKRELVMCISTNGTLIKPELARRLSQFDSLYFQVSLDGATAETNDGIRGRGSYSRALRGLEALASEGLELSVNCVLTRSNFAQLDAIYEIARSHNAKLRVTRLRPAGRGQSAWKDLHPSREQYRDFTRWLGEHEDVLTADSFFHLNAFGQKLRGLDACGAATATCCIAPEAEVFPCAFFQASEFCAGNLHEQTFAEIWRSSPIFQAYRNMEAGECAGCGQYTVCNGGCPATKWFVTHSLAVRDPECVLVPRGDPRSGRRMLPVVAAGSGGRLV